MRTSSSRRTDALNQLVKTVPQVETKALPATASGGERDPFTEAVIVASSVKLRQALQLTPPVRRRYTVTSHRRATIPALAADDAAAVVAAADEANGAWRPAADAAEREQ